ncbi:MAG TPA: pentapeptide repeat-containing protein [Ktedonobacterales bacterium]|nr:pentapeptide repeat-containing protein [Ktedonobacterales bacterium]
MSAQEPTPPDPTAYGQPITSERQAELQAILDAWDAETDHGERQGPFHGTALTGADASWLAEQSGRNEFGWVPNLHLEGAKLGEAHLERASLYEAHLERADLNHAHLEEANLAHAHLDGANLSTAHLEGAALYNTELEGANIVEAHLKGALFLGAYLKEADLSGADLERANLYAAHLERANLIHAQLARADLGGAFLERADLEGAQLTGANLSGASLEGASLRSAVFDNQTVLNGAVLDTDTSLGDIHWNGVGTVDLTQVRWGTIQRLGDETTLPREASADKYESTVRAYRQMAAQLRAQGMNEVADRFSYRAQVVQRRVLRKRRQLGRWFGAWVLDAVSGHGYHPMRSVYTYVLVIASFAIGYFFLGGALGQALSWNEALVVSMTAFHGRGFFGSAFQPGDPQAAVAAVEALIGLLIEIIFIATFTQRFFGAK